MSIDSGVEWTDATWNPVTGCTKVSPGCKYCYAERLAGRLKAMGNGRYARGFALTLQPDQLALPLGWRRPRRVFVNSMSDLFHEKIPAEYLHRVFDVMAKADWHLLQILTKRSARLAAMASILAAFERNWAKRCPGVVTSLREGGDKLLTFFSFPRHSGRRYGPRT